MSDDCVPIRAGTAGRSPLRDGGEGARPIRVAVLGSTGSIGESALKVMRRHPGRFEVTVLAANRSIEALGRQVDEHRPSRVVVADESAYELCRGNGAEWKGGREALLEAATHPDVDVVLNALVGFAGLEPTLRALEAGKRVALANKESLVAGGDLVIEAIRKGKGELIPVDSEHSAILQCLNGDPEASVARLGLTASGGPFRGWDPDRLTLVTPSDALDHPTWEMGAKISIDSATLANKALEVIEAHFLYGISYDRIEVVVHPQSIVHSFVEFVDGSVMAQMGFPTMELPILYALTYPDRMGDAELRTFDPVRSSPLTFEEPDRAAFPLLGIGVDAGRTGGTASTAFNAANEVAVSAFLDRSIPFPGIWEVVGETLARVGSRPVNHIDDVVEADREARRVARELLPRHNPAPAESDR